MLKDITLGQYFPGNSIVHKIDPRVKILLTFAYIVILFLVNSFLGYGIVLVFTSAVVLLSKVPVSYILRGIKPILFLLVLTSLLNIFMTPGEAVLYQWGFIKITREGLIMAGLMVLRLFFLIIGTSLLTYTTSPILLTDGIERLLSPLKKIHVPAHEIAMMMTIALRFIPTLFEETDKIMKAQMARGADFESGNLMNRAKSMIPLLVPLFVSAFRRADDLAVAMECRCYHGGENRTRLKVLKVKQRDFYAVGYFVLMGALLFFVRFL